MHAIGIELLQTNQQTHIPMFILFLVFLHRAFRLNSKRNDAEQEEEVEKRSNKPESANGLRDFTSDYK